MGLEAKSHSWLRFFGLGVQFRVEVEDFGLKTFVGSSRIRKSLRGRSLRNKSCEFPRVLYIYISIITPSPILFVKAAVL